MLGQSDKYFDLFNFDSIAAGCKQPKNQLNNRAEFTLCWKS